MTIENVQNKQESLDPLKDYKVEHCALQTPHSDPSLEALKNAELATIEKTIIKSEAFMDNMSRGGWL